MASKKENLKSLFTNTRTRVIIIFTAVLILTAVIVGLYKLKFSSNLGSESSNVSNTPSIQSIPGALDQTIQYAKLQQKQNVEQAKTALKSGESAIPTIIRSQALGEGVQPVGVVTEGQGGVGFSTLGREDEEGTQRQAWIQTLGNKSCSKAAMDQVISEGATADDLKSACSCTQLRDNGYPIAKLELVCSCKELRAAGFNARQLKEAGFSAGKLRLCDFDACELRNAGFTAQEMKDGGFTDGELKGAGFSATEIAKTSGLPVGMTAEMVRSVGCSVEALKKLRDQGVTAAAIRRISGCSVTQLKAAGFSAQELRDAGFTAADLKNAGFTAGQLKAAGYDAKDLADAGFTQQKQAGDCSAASLRAARAAGVSAATIKRTLGCGAAALKAAGYTAKELRDAGFTAAELRNAGFSAAALRAAGFSAKELKDAGFSAADLKDAGFSASELKDAGFTAAELKAAGYSAKDLKDAGYSAKDLRDAGFSAAALKDAGFSAAELKAGGYSAKDLKAAGYSARDLKVAGFNDNDLKDAGFSVPNSQVAGLEGANLPGQIPSNLAGIPGPGQPPLSAAAAAQAANAQQLQNILNKQNQQLNDQRYQQQIQQRTSEMYGAASQVMQNWQRVSTQVYTAGNESEKGAPGTTVLPGFAEAQGPAVANPNELPPPGSGPNNSGTPIIKTGDILFAVIDTSVNSDEPGPILATIVSGPLKGSKLIGSFNLPANANKMVISFNTLSVPGASKTVSVSAYAIDANTARTALSSKTDHHYLKRYGSLFAATFLEGFGNAFQSANTTVTIGGTGGGQNITVQNGIHRSALQNAVIGLATLGKNWGQVAHQQFNTPTTVEVFSGTGVGVLFTQDLTTF